MGTAASTALGPTWEPDEAVLRCRQCSTEFGLFTRRHHCRNCGKIFCDDCCNRRMMLKKFGYVSSVRVCIPCSVIVSNEKADIPTLPKALQVVDIDTERRSQGPNDTSRKAKRLTANEVFAQGEDADAICSFGESDCLNKDEQNQSEQIVNNDKIPNITNISETSTATTAKTESITDTASQDKIESNHISIPKDTIIRESQTAEERAALQELLQHTALEPDTSETTSMPFDLSSVKLDLLNLPPCPSPTQSEEPTNLPILQHDFDLAGISIDKLSALEGTNSEIVEASINQQPDDSDSLHDASFPEINNESLQKEEILVSKQEKLDDESERKVEGTKEQEKSDTEPETLADKGAENTLDTSFLPNLDPLENIQLPTEQLDDQLLLEQAAKSLLQHQEELQENNSNEGLKLDFNLGDLNLDKLDAMAENDGAAEVQQLIIEYAVKEDVNAAGMRKRKGSSAIRGQKPPKPVMEDTNSCCYPFYNNRSRGLFAVFDGHVSKNAASAARDILPEVFHTTLEAANPNDLEDVAEVFQSTFKEVDQRMIQFEDEGTTATAVYVWSTTDGRRLLQAANLGDSAAFLWVKGEEGEKVIPLTVDHRVNDPHERERLKEAGNEITDGQTRINGLSVSRALGDHFVKLNQLGLISEPYITSPMLLDSTKTYTLILASDGLWDVITGEKAAQVIKKGENASQMASLLLKTALQFPQCTDNITVIIVRL